MSIICGAAVFSVWLFSRSVNTTSTLSEVGTSTTTIDVVPSQSPRQNITTNDDWQKILLTSNTVTPDMSVIQDQNNTYPNEGTLTDQMAKDFFGQYFQIVKNNNGTVSEDDANQIVMNTLSSPKYTQDPAPVYIASNLHITQKTDAVTMQTYFNNLQKIYQDHIPSEDELDIFKKATDTNDPTPLKQLDPIITNYTGTLQALLNTTVPSNAVSVHLAVINAVSSVLQNIQSMRTAFDDPVRAFAATGQYPQHIGDLEDSMTSMSAFFTSQPVSGTH